MFRTKFDIAAPDFKINYEDNILSLGSCFAQNMGERFQTLKFKSWNNPLGISYNPISIADSLNSIQTQRLFTKKDLFFHQDCWHSWAHHGVFSHPDADVVLGQINEAIQAVPQTIGKLLLTFGSAYAYRYKESGRIVANCHKVPNNQFDKIRLQPNEVAETILSALETFQTNNPDLKTVLTVSPVRHIRDGIIENQRSKAALLLACEQVVKYRTNAYYFPSYELVMDDLRDYRFYESDMLHPNPLAQDYIWEKLVETLFGKTTKTTTKTIHKLNQSLRHRPLHPDTPSHQLFLGKLLEKIDRLEKEYPALDFREEREAVCLSLSE